MFSYRAYQLFIDSELALPELAQASLGLSYPPDVTVHVGDIDVENVEWSESLEDVLWISPQHLLLDVEGVARFLASNGRQVLIEPAHGADPDSIRLYLLGSVLGAILLQRGYLVLHGNAIRIGQHCLVCVGDSGAGKSTLAAGFLKRGYAVLADDVVPIDNTGRAIPGFPRIKLWQDAAEHLDIDTVGLRRIRPEMEKFNFPVEQAKAIDQPLPVRWVVNLIPDDVSSVEISAVSGVERFRLLLQNTYRSYYLRGMAKEGQHFQQCGELAARVHVAQVRRPNRRFSLDDLIDVLLVEMERNP